MQIPYGLCIIYLNESQNALGWKDHKDHVIPNPFQRECQLPTRPFHYFPFLSASCPVWSVWEQQHFWLKGNAGFLLQRKNTAVQPPMANPPRWCIHTSRFGPVLRWTECNRTKQNKPYIPLPNNFLTNKAFLSKIWSSFSKICPIWE